MNATSNRTTEPPIIKQWVESRRGRPARVRLSHEQESEYGGILRIEFPGRDEEEHLESIDWETFFRAFRAQNLTFFYDEETSYGRKSRFCSLVRQISKEA